MEGRYPRFGPCPFCGEPMFLSLHVSSIAAGVLSGLLTLALLKFVFG